MTRLPQQPLTFGSFCSGICAPEVAWTSLGWKPLFVSEIDPFAIAVEQHHFPNVPQLGDMEKIDEQTLSGFRPDAVCAGTPCQSFSVAGLRKGLDDPRGNMALVFLRLLDRLRPTWVVWENVPGVLSVDSGRAFGAFLGGLGQLGYGFAYRVLDAQHFGVPQRRRRVFVVGHLGDWRRAAAVLFERHSLSGHPAPRRQAGSRIAASLTRGADSGGKGGYAGRRREDDFNIVNALDTMQGGADDNSAQAGHLIASTGEIAHSLNAGGMGRQDYETETLIAHTLRGEGFDASDDETGRGTPIVPVGCTVHGTNKTARTASRTDVAGSLRTNPPGSIENSSTTVVLQPVAFAQNSRDEVRLMGGDGQTVGALAAEPGMKQQCFASTVSGVRRLTPRECERLQGFSDDFTLIPYRGKFSADGPRYRAIGNSMAVPVLAWIGRRIMEARASA